MISPEFLAAIGSLIFVLYLYLTRSLTRSVFDPVSLPPGPKKLPLIGNLLDMPNGFAWKTFHHWSKEYDTDIIHLNVVGTSIIVLDTIEAATELLSKRSSIYSGRARMPMINELMGWDFNFGFMDYGMNTSYLFVGRANIWFQGNAGKVKQYMDYMRQHRKLMHRTFHPTAALHFHPHELKATHELLRRLLEDPKDFMAHLRHLAGASILSIVYGIEALPSNDPFIDVVEQGGRSLMVAASPGAYLVDFIPILKYVPEWMPFAGFQRRAKEWRKLALGITMGPFDAAKCKIASGTAIPSFTSHCLQNMDESHDVPAQEAIIQATAASMFSVAGADSIMAAIASCILGLLINPEVQRKAQQEIDSIVQHGSLPDFNDEDSLPYVTAVVKETLRWRDVTPIAFPHFIAVDDIYKGYRLPAGSIIIANAWAMLHEEDIYPDPFTFNPDRFMKDGKLNPDVKDPQHAAFGFGRRICPGRYMAYSTIWVAIANILATFDITKAVNENGQVIEPSHDYVSGVVCAPLPFDCNIESRSKDIEEIIKSTAHNEYSFDELV